VAKPHAQNQNSKMDNSNKTPYILITITVFLLAVSLTVLFTQKKSAEITPLLTDAEAQELDLKLPENSAVQSYQNLLIEGDLNFADRNYKRALAYYIAAYKINQNALTPYLKIINVYLTTENYEIAKKNIDLAKEKSPGNQDVIRYEVSLLLAQENVDDALKIIEPINPVTEQLKLYHIIALMLKSDHQTAKKELAELNKVTSDKQISKVSLDLTNNYEIYSTFETGNDAYLDTLIGQTLINFGETKIARSFFYRAIQKSNDYRDAWIGLGYAFLRIKNYTEAEEALNRAKQVDPYKAEIYFYLSLVATEQGNHSRALGLLTQAKNYNYNNSIELAEHFANNYYALKNYQEAIANFELVINAKTVPITYYIAPIWIHLEQTKDHQKALTIAQKALEKYPDNAYSYNYLGWINIYQGNYDEAKNNLTTAISKNPQLAPAYLNFGQLYLRQGKNEAALPFFEKAKTLALVTKDDSIYQKANSEIIRLNSLNNLNSSNQPTTTSP
jgi:tetratricopeptide (TPR) repeat protein